MKRGDIWTVAGGPDYSGKPRDAVIIQSDEFDAMASITVCPFTTNDMIAPLFRIPVAASERNGLRSSSNLMVDKIGTLPKSRLGKRLGRIDDEDMLRLNRGIMVFFGLTFASSRLSDS